MLPPSGQPLSESESRNLGHDPGKQDGGSVTLLQSITCF